MHYDSTYHLVALGHIYIHAGIRVLGKSTTEIDYANALGAYNNVIQIYSNSWGPRDDGRSISPPSENELIERVIEMSTKEVINLFVHRISLTACMR